jgi:hypothetical protein
MTTPKSVKSRNNRKGASPHRLRTIGDIVTEMGRCYRLVRAGKMKSAEYTKLIYGLDKTREAISHVYLETEYQRELKQRLRGGEHE